MATMTALSLWALADDVTVDETDLVGTANCSYVRNLLECITIDQGCELVKDMIGCGWSQCEWTAWEEECEKHWTLQEMNRTTRDAVSAGRQCKGASARSDGAHRRIEE